MHILFVWMEVVRGGKSISQNLVFLLLILVDSLFESKAVSKSKYGVHKVVVGRDDFTAKDITVQAHAFTKTAREAIEGAGGKCELLKASTGAVIAA
jgi:ribosomal protein L15